MFREFRTGGGTCPWSLIQQEVRMDCDEDDELPQPTLADIYWWYMNRLAQLGMALFPLTYRKKEAVMKCENPTCGNKAEITHRFQDPRRGHGEEIAYVRRFCCSAECAGAINDELERQAQYARLVQ